MNISNSGLSFLRDQEGEELTGYHDTRGIPTIGVGHTGKVDGEPVSIGMLITADKSLELLKGDLAWVEQCIAIRVTVSLNKNQYDALCSLIFNIGAPAFSTSTLLKLLNAGDYYGAASQFLEWKRAGSEPNGLLPRRQRERGLFLLSIAQ